jgi:hypothetical protein
MKTTISFEFDKYEDGVKNTEGENKAIMMMKAEDAFSAIYKIQTMLERKIAEADSVGDSTQYILVENIRSQIEEIIVDYIPDFDDLFL